MSIWCLKGVYLRQRLISESQLGHLKFTVSLLKRCVAAGTVLFSTSSFFKTLVFFQCRDLCTPTHLYPPSLSLHTVKCTSDVTFWQLRIHGQDTSRLITASNQVTLTDCVMTKAVFIRWHLVKCSVVESNTLFKCFESVFSTQETKESGISI